MKKMILIFVAVLTVNAAFGQDIEKNDYQLKGDVIEATLYHSNGGVAQTGTYNLDNQLHGHWISYDVHGNKTADAFYNNGEKVGTWIFYQGQEKKEVSYVNSKIAQVKTWEVTDTRIVSN